MRAQAEAARLLSDEHFTVDGTLVEAWASHKNFRQRADGPAEPPPDDPQNPTVDFHGDRRSNATHRSTTDPDVRLYRKTAGQPAELVYLGHVVAENRHGLIVESEVTLATGRGERETATEMLSDLPEKDGRTRFVATARRFGSRRTWRSTRRLPSWTPISLARVYPYGYTLFHEARQVGGQFKA